MINTTDLNYFLKVAEAQNISRAADLIGITQPSLSTALKRLEVQVDAALLIRDRQGVHLTRAGEVLFRDGQKLLAECIRIQKDLKKQDNEVCGCYSIGCHPSVALYSLPMFLPSLAQQHGELEISLKHGLSREITDQVVRGQVDFGIVINPVPQNDLVLIKLGEDRVGFWRSTKKNPLNQMDSERTTLIYDPDLFQSQWLLRSLKSIKNKFNRFATSADLGVVTSLVAAGGGVGILPSRVVECYKLSRLVRFQDPWPIFKDKIFLIYRQDSQRNIAAKTIVSAIKGAFKK